MLDRFLLTMSVIRNFCFNNCYCLFNNNFNLQEVWDGLWCIHKNNGNVSVCVELSHRCTLNTTFNLIDFKDISLITSLDVSSCVSMESTSIVDIMPAFKTLKIFVYRNCKNVTEHNLVRIAMIQQNLEYIDGSSGSCVSFASGLVVLATLNKLQKIAVEPHVSEIYDWAHLIFQFSNVTFGSSIKNKLPIEAFTSKEAEKFLNNSC